MLLAGADFALFNLGFGFVFKADTKVTFITVSDDKNSIYFP
jgi:hypothetical protein